MFLFPLVLSLLQHTESPLIHPAINLKFPGSNHTLWLPQVTPDQSAFGAPTMSIRIRDNGAYRK